ncbi:MAG: hypothetical protein LAO05_15400 [Acidobacteriia bacterium]|nr:hypothetical protein [Terriglobia bacterium]
MTNMSGRLYHVVFVLFSVGLAPAVAGALVSPPAPRFPGVATSVAINRADGRVAVLQGATLSIYSAIGAEAPSAAFEIPGSDPAVLEFRGNQVLYATHGVNNMPVVLVAVSVEGRERLAWPNPGISDLFPTEASRLTLDGKGVYGFLPLDPPARAFFGLPNEIPLGAGVAATYRFAGEKLLARGSEAFAAVVALSPDDMVLALRGGGLMRYRSPGGVAWKREGRGGDWRVADVDPSAGLVVTIDGQGAAVGTDLEKGEPRWRCTTAGTPIRDAQTMLDGRLLTLTGGDERTVTELDPATGRPSGTQLVDLCEREGLSKVLAELLAKAQSLSALVSVATPGGSAWLIRGPDGWYLVPRR